MLYAGIQLSIPRSNMPASFVRARLDFTCACVNVNLIAIHAVKQHYFNNQCTPSAHA